MSTPKPELPEWARPYLPLLDASLDACALLSTEGHVLQVNSAMKVFLALEARALLRSAKPLLTELLQFTGKPDSFPMGEALLQPLREDELPVQHRKTGERHRLLLGATPIRAPGTGLPEGLFLTLRDSTAEILLQAKYTKLLQMLDQKNEEIADLRNQLGLQR
jgi:hypothetical protein